MKGTWDSVDLHNVTGASLHKVFALGLLATLAQPVIASDAGTECSNVGPNMRFCSGETFKRLDSGQRNGISYWSHSGGFVSKVLTERDSFDLATQNIIEGRIIAMINAQAEAAGHDFEFFDLDSRSLHGAPFGTLTYQLTNAETATVVFHSYAALNGLVVQVLSQIAAGDGSESVTALKSAHFEAIGALKPIQPTDEL